MNTNDPFDNYVPDNQEFRNFPNDDLWLVQDSDGDGLTNQEEIIRGTNPFSADTDGDGLRDFQELAMGTNPLHPDTDLDGVRDGVDQWHGPEPNQAFSPHDAEVAFAYERLSQSIDSSLPPFLQAKQVAQEAFAEDYTASDVHEILSQSPQFKEIESNVGSEQADQFTRIAITAAEREAAIDSLPDPPQVQVQEQMQPRCPSPRLGDRL